MALSSIMDTGKLALGAAQTAISVTSQNIANVDTEGYSRRTVNFAEAYTINTAGGTVGTGVWAENIQRSYSQYIENQYYDQATLRDRWENLYTNLSNTQSLFNEAAGYGLSNTLQSFFTAWDDLTQATDSASSRNTVLTNSQTLISTLKGISTDLTTQAQEADRAIEQQVSEVNDILKQVAALNKQISSTSADTSSLQDSRSALVRSLSSYLDINYIDNSDGSLTLTTQAGQTLVAGSDYFDISYDGPQATSALTASSTFDGQVYFGGSDTQEYTLQVVQAGDVSSGAGAALLRVSVDGGKTWLTDKNGNELHYAARTEDTAANVGELSIWFGSDSDSNASPSGTLAVGDKFTITPMKALYWNENTSTKENITPFTTASGTQDTSRLTGGTLSALCSYKNDYIGAYQEKLDSIANSLAWEVNRVHSQGTGLTNLSEVNGTYSAKHDNMALGSNSAGLTYGSRLTPGSAFMYIYNTSTGLQVKGGALDFSSNASGLNFNPATDSLEDVCSAVNNTFGSYLTATIVNHKLTISAKDGYSFNMGTDTTGLYAALGLNTYFTGSTASNLGVNMSITTNTDRLCAGHVDAAGEANAGDSTTASSISDLLTKKVSITSLRGGTVSQTISGYYSGLVSKVGADTSQANYKYKYTEALASDLDDQQQAVSGVNLDEEMTNLIKYQHAYTAAAKLITTADEMFQTVLALKS
ncbi:MAG: flagellar hook-associated protein FlgK [Desulfovibrionaceae bacterium CG1_02_65_16]|nr:MAG: flagellar hook-associated protein FlgK [Desulfovibrionaceae bacterium CG1_02_65_16]